MVPDLTSLASLKLETRNNSKIIFLPAISNIRPVVNGVGDPVSRFRRKPLQFLRRGVLHFSESWKVLNPRILSRLSPKISIKDSKEHYLPILTGMGCALKNSLYILNKKRGAHSTPHNDC
jgi:hypothetical protein